MSRGEGCDLHQFGKGNKKNFYFFAAEADQLEKEEIAVH